MSDELNKEINETSVLKPSDGEVESNVMAEQQIDQQVEQIHDASDLLPSGAKAKLEKLFQDIDQAPNYKEKKKLWADFFAENPQVKEYIQQLRKIQGMVDISEGLEKKPTEGQSESEVTDDELAKAAEKFVEAVDDLEPKMAKALFEGTKKILDQGPLTEGGIEMIKLELAKANVPESAWSDFIQKISAEKITDEQLKGITQKLVEDNVEATVATMVDVDQYKSASGQYTELLDKARNMRPDDPSRREILGEMTKGTEDLLDDFPMDGFLDLVFATGSGMGGHYHGRHEKWGETANENETVTSEVLENVLDEEEGAALFFAKLTDTHKTEVWQDLLSKLDVVFSSLEEADDNTKNAIKKLVSDSVTEASGAPGLTNVELKVENINLSPNVLKMIVKRARKYLDAKQAT